MSDRHTTMRGNPQPLLGPELKPGDAAPPFTLTDNALGAVTLNETSGVRIFSVIPSLDTPVCDVQTRRFNEESGNISGVTIYTVSRDLPFAQKRWCGAAGVENVKTLSDYKDGNFGNAWGTMIGTHLILSRAIFVVDSSNKIVYVQYVGEVADHPDYDAALAAAKSAS